MSAFDPSTFLDMTTAEAGSTSIEPIPAGEYTAIIESVEPKPFISKRTGQEGIVVECNLVLQAPEVASRLGRDKLTARYSFYPDLTPQGGFDMAKGKNVSLNRLRDACGLNVPGQPFKLSMLMGKPLKAVLSHRVVGDAVYTDVKTVGKI